MSRFTRVLGLVGIIAFPVGPLSMAPAFAQPNAPAQLAQSTGGATVSGTATDQSGAPLGGVSVTMQGPHTYTTTAAADGTFSISGVVPGVYTVTSEKVGYGSVSDS